MATSELKPTVIPLTKGLDLTSPKLVAEQGSLVDNINYELVDFSGYKRIDGYERYDGRASPSITQYYRISTTDSVASYVLGDVLVADKTVFYSTEVIAPTFLDLDGLGSYLVDENGDYIVTTAGSGSSTSTGPFGVVLGTGNSGSTNYIYFAALNRRYFPSNGATVYRVDLSSGSNVNSITATTIQVDHDFDTPEDVYTNLLSYQESLRGLISELPGTPIGLHWFRDRLYAVSGLAKLKLVSVDSGTGNPTTGDQGAATMPALGETITSDGGKTVTVLSATDLGFEPAGFTDVNVVELLVAGISSTALIGETFSDIGWGGPTVVGKVETISSDSTRAGLWVCKSIEQTILEDTPALEFGWKEINLGWYFRFDNGNVPAGYFDKLERNDDSNLGNYYYFSNGVTTFRAKIVSYFVDTGTLTGGNAVGYLQINSLERTAGTGTYIDNTYDMYSDVGLSTKVADIISTMSYNYLPGIEDIVNAGTRYQFISSNFYGNDTYDAFYGVNGVGRAFYYDGTLFAKIYTQGDSDLDIPRHVANHLGHLALGYRLGSVQLSVIGSPWNFSGILGASEIAVGDKVIGLSVLNGTMLAVFCEQSVWGISGSTVDNFTSQILVPNLGAIEYSIVDMGQPVFTTNWGVSTLSQSEKYGDFVGARVSQMVNPWLLPKLVDRNSQVYGSAGVLCAIPVRAKNQYRLFFKDGSIMSMTLNADGPPGFTFQQYDNNVTDTPVVPLCHSSQVDQFGKERIHFGHWSEDAGGSSYVYEGDIGWSFDGELIPAYFETNWVFDSPNGFITTAGVRLHGVTQGKASLKVDASSIDTSYEDNYSGSVSQPINLDRGLTRDVYQTYVPATNKSDLARRGLAIKYKVSSTATSNEPPHVCQLMTVYTRQGGLSDSP